MSEQTPSVNYANVRGRDTMSLGNRCGFYSRRDVYRILPIFRAKGPIGHLCGSGRFYWLLGTRC